MGEAKRRQSRRRQMIEDAVDPGVKERPPIPGVHYVAFVVHPSQPGPITLAIAHRDCERDLYVLDLCRETLTVADSAELASEDLWHRQSHGRDKRKH
jgi:hypothetical protein